MSPRNAPIYVRAHDLARWIHGHTSLVRARSQPDLAAELDALSRRLVTETALALAFPVTRHEHQRRADEALVGLRVRLRLSRDLAATTAAQLRHASAELDAIGRMLGGWRRQWRIERWREQNEAGAKAEPARTV